MVVLSGVALFTEINVILPLKLFACYNLRRKWRIWFWVIVLWLITYVGNVCGTLLVGVALRGVSLSKNTFLKKNTI